ncbi:uncharacterized protein YcbX [Conyzicola lurida]|uniref:Uncharacterized protein YcbX n=1 Tax=Conyzicola lurida TaxID=1172621 RepID=A0A841ARE2_9MICO|nr:MOSC domain-containing protein [Conyzicola lurida]MBB5844135.1 uncharacterized protein YcbX [Conyzicola lurida]
MQISSLGSSPLKGARHSEHESLDFALDGPVGDREFAVVDLANRRVLKTVEHPALLACEATWIDGVLSITVAGEEFAAVPDPVGDEIELDYWGRPAVVRVVDGPWMPRLASLLGRDVALVRAARPGAVVYGDSVTLVTTGSLLRLAATVGHAVPASRFRATAVVDTGDDAHVEDSWAGRDLAVGGATVRVAAGIARCAVIDFDPTTGESGTRLLKTLAGYRLRSGDIDFGVYATVVAPGTVRRGDPVRLLDR